MLHVHRADRADALVAALGDVLARAPDDPFAPEVVAVPTRGMERWLAQRLSARLGASGAGADDGVCANVAFPPPRRLLGDAIAAAAGVDPETDPWRPERAVWPLLDVVATSLGEPWLSGLADHLGGAGADPDPALRGRRFAAVRHVAGLFDRYALHRPDMVLAWARGEDVDGVGGALGPDRRWQAELWRRLDLRLRVPGPAARLDAACRRLAGEPGVVDLPDRVALFGMTRMPAGDLAVLRALAAGRDVHLLLLHPSPVLWSRIAAEVTAPVVRRRADPTAELPSNRLLASWGQDARELQLVLGPAGGYVDHHHAADGAGGTLLARIQADVRADRRPPGPPAPGEADERPVLAPDDLSVQVHACHGRARQVEVVRDALLHAFAQDPTLEPRDVIVMCPDIEAFAPLIQATFGAGEVAGQDDELDALPEDVRPPDLRVRLADRALRQTNPVLGVVARLLEIAAGRLTASEVLDLADREPVRRRFTFDDDAVARLEDWAASANVRWGLDGPHRRPYGLAGLAAGTWRAGLDRVLVGVAMTEEDQRLLGGVLPLDDVESGAIDLAGRFAELVDRVGAAVDALTVAQPVDLWAAALGAAADALTSTSSRDGWQRAELQRLLDDVVREATQGGATAGVPLELPEVRALLGERLKGRPTRANFRTGHLTFCTLVPMRAVPHRVVVLLGLDDAVFPRKAPRDGDDLVLDLPHVGDRDGRTEDRQQLLDALLAASERLLITYTGNDERTNAPRPPAVPVGELLDVVDRTVRTEDPRRRARDQVTSRHPLQPFDPRCFTPGALRRDGPWSFDAVTLEGAEKLVEDRPEPAPFLAAPLPPLPAGLVELDHLVTFVERPVRAFLRQRLGISVTASDEEVADALPVELGGLEEWSVGQRLVDARLAGASVEACVQAELARGALPPGVLANPVLQRIGRDVELLVGYAAGLPGHGVELTSVDVQVALPDDRGTVRGTVPRVAGDVLRFVTYSKVSARHRLAAWVRLLALTAADPARPWEALTLGRSSDRDSDVTISRMGPLGDDAATRRAVALEQLAKVVDLRDRALREPPPLACLTSAAYARAAQLGWDVEAAVEGAWTSVRWDKEDRDPEHQLVHGGALPVVTLLAEPPREDEAGPGWHDEDPSRFGRWARRLWDGPLAHEQMVDR